MAVSKSAVGERKPYRLIRGHYSRREGDAVALRDDKGAKLGVKGQPYVRYQAATTENPNARNELLLTDREAEALKGRVMPLFRHNARTGQEERHDPQAEPPKPLDELIATGMAVNGTKSLNDFRSMVLKSGHLKGMRTIPSKKHDLLAALRAVQMSRAQAQADGDDGKDDEAAA